MLTTPAACWPPLLQKNRSFLVLFFKKEQVFFLKKEAKTFIPLSSRRAGQGGRLGHALRALAADRVKARNPVLQCEDDLDGAGRMGHFEVIRTDPVHLGSPLSC
jgi:hypothetical protein